MKTCAEIDSLLTPYIDGEAGRGEWAAVEAHLAVCLPCRTRAAAERAARQVVRARAAALGAHAPVDLRARCAGIARPPGGQVSLLGVRPHAPRRVPGWVPLSMAASLLLAIGAVFFSGMNDELEASFAAQLTIDHMKCFLLTDPEAALDAQEAEARLEDRYALQITVPASDEVEQLELVDARRCVYEDGYVAHLLYERQGRPVSLFVLPNTTRRERLLEIMGHDAIIWSEAGMAFVLLGQEGPSDMGKVAAYVRRVTQ